MAAFEAGRTREGPKGGFLLRRGNMRIPDQLKGPASASVRLAFCLAGVLFFVLCSTAGAFEHPLPINTVFIILMENYNWSEIKGAPDCPYINNTLLPMASHCEQF